MGTLKEEQDYDFAAFFILGVFDRTGTVLLKVLLCYALAVSLCIASLFH